MKRSGDSKPVKLGILAWALGSAAFWGCNQLGGSSSVTTEGAQTYQGCIQLANGGPFALKVTFSFPSEGDRVTVLRDNIEIFQSTDAAVVSFTDANLDAGKTYQYKCVLHAGDNSYPGVLTPSMTVGDPLDGYTGCLSVSGVGTVGAQVSFQFPEGASKAIVARNGVDVFTTSTATETSVTNMDLSVGTIYEYTCKVEVGGQIRTGASKLQFVIQDPPFVGCRSVTPLDAARISVSYEVPANADRVWITRDGAQVFSGGVDASGTFVDTGLAATTDYIYACYASFGVRDKLGSNVVTARTMTLPTLSYAGAGGTFGVVNSSLQVVPTTLSGQGEAITACALATGSDPLPAGLTLSAANCRITGAPTVTASANLKIVVTTVAGSSAAATLHLTISAGVPEVSYAGATGTDGTVNSPMQVAPTQLAANGAPITGCALTGDSPTLPVTLTLNLTTCVISGTPTAPMARTTFRVLATNSEGSSDMAPVTLSVVP